MEESPRPLAALASSGGCWVLSGDGSFSNVRISRNRNRRGGLHSADPSPGQRTLLGWNQHERLRPMGYRLDPFPDSRGDDSGCSLHLCPDHQSGGHPRHSRLREQVSAPHVPNASPRNARQATLRFKKRKVNDECGPWLETMPLFAY